MTFFELADMETRESLSSYFGASAPTVQRWVSSREYPSYVDIVISLHEEINKLKVSIEDNNMLYINLLSKVRTYKFSQDDLFSSIP